MIEKYLFDTTWLINSFQKQDRDSQKVIQGLSLKAPIAISAISITEIRAGLKGKQIEYAMPKIISIFKVEIIDYTIAEKAGQLLNKYWDNGLSTGDAIIAATTLIHGYTLLSDDCNFSIIKELNIFKQ